MVLPLRKRASPDAASLERRRTQGSFLSPGGWLTLLVVCVFGSGAALAPVAYWWGYMAGQREADEDAVYAAVSDAIRVGTKVAGLQDTVRTLRRTMAAEAAKRLPKRVVDSLRNAHWTMPDTTRGIR